MAETARRRELQMKYNTEHGITPKTIAKAIKDITETISSDHQKTVARLLAIDLDAAKVSPEKLITQKEQQMEGAVKILDFETAAILRDEIVAIKAHIDKLAATEKKKAKKRSEG